MSVEEARLNDSLQQVVSRRTIIRRGVGFLGGVLAGGLTASYSDTLRAHVIESYDSDKELVGEENDSHASFSIAESQRLQALRTDIASERLAVPADGVTVADFHIGEAVGVALPESADGERIFVFAGNTSGSGGKPEYEELGNRILFIKTQNGMVVDPEQQVGRFIPRNDWRPGTYGEDWKVGDFALTDMRLRLLENGHILATGLIENYTNIKNNARDSTRSVITEIDPNKPNNPAVIAIIELDSSMPIDYSLDKPDIAVNEAKDADGNQGVPSYSARISPSKVGSMLATYRGSDGQIKTAIYSAGVNVEVGIQGWKDNKYFIYLRGFGQDGKQALFQVTFNTDTEEFGEPQKMLDQNGQNPFNNFVSKPDVGLQIHFPEPNAFHLEVGGNNEYSAAVSSGFIDEGKTKTTILGISNNETGVSSIFQIPDLLLPTVDRLDSQEIRVLGYANYSERRVDGTLTARLNPVVLHFDPATNQYTIEKFASFDRGIETVDGNGVRHASSTSHYTNPILIRIGDQNHFITIIPEVDKFEEEISDLPSMVTSIETGNYKAVSPRNQ